MAELHRWIRKTDSSGQKKLWERVYEEFRNIGMDEEVVRLLDMQIELVAQHGPVDISLLELARRHLHLSPTILTVERWLALECVRARIGSARLLIDVCHAERM